MSGGTGIEHIRSRSLFDNRHKDLYSIRLMDQVYRRIGRRQFSPLDVFSWVAVLPDQTAKPHDGASTT